MKHNGIDKNILKKYSLLQILGKGAYGVVWRATDKKTGGTVAIKKIFYAFSSLPDAKRTLREIIILQELYHHDNIVKLLDVIKAEGDRDIYLVFEKMDTDLLTIIESNILEDIHIQYIMYQLLRALKYLHTGGLIHRDLKPSNLLINSDCHVKLGDFGLARSLHQIHSDEEQNIYLTEYIGTRWYRAPEVILGSRNYTKSVDMWSCGCIFAELLSGKPLFPGSSLGNQLYRILEIVGKIGNSDFEAIESNIGKQMYSNFRPTKTKKLSEVIPHAPKEAIDLLTKLIKFNPEKRVTAEEALQHPYLAKFHNPHDEPHSLRKIFTPIEYDCSNISDIRKKVYNEIFQRRKETKKKLKAKEEIQKLLSKSGNN